MWIKRQIPNLFTAANLICGVYAIIYAFEHQNDHFHFAVYFLLAGAGFDFFDGMVARLLNVSSEMGKQLDSLADMVSFGVAPGIVFYLLLVQLGAGNMALLALLIPFFSLFRLAKFNVDTRQSTGFIGLPTPANTLFWSGIILFYQNPSLEVPLHFWYVLLVLFTPLMVLEFPMFSLKLKSKNWKDYRLKITLLLLSFPILWYFGFIGLSFVIILYLILSGLNLIFKIES